RAPPFLWQLSETSLQGGGRHRLPWHVAGGASRRLAIRHGELVSCNRSGGCNGRPWATPPPTISPALEAPNRPRRHTLEYLNGPSGPFLFSTNRKDDVTPNEWSKH